MTTPGSAPRAAMVGLASLPSLSPRSLADAVAHHGADEAWGRVRSGRPWSAAASARFQPGTWPALVRQARAVDPVEQLDRCERCGAQVLVRGDPAFPQLLAGDIDPPPVLFVAGSLDALRGRRVGVVGTRNATAAGRATAFELGERLAASGVTVVSGLARGIDGAAHRGVRAVGGRAVAVVGSGIDVPYPRQHRDLWDWVAGNGLLVSEFAPGREAQPWHFPLRNRMIAALSEVLVVVESRERGGSLITAKLALARGVTVFAVPGSINARSSRGTNELISEGVATLLTSVDDVLIALGLDTSRAAGEVPLPFDTPVRPAPISLEGRVFALCAERPRTLDDLVVELGVGIAEAAMAAARLERDGWLADTGGWFETVGSKLGRP